MKRMMQSTGHYIVGTFNNKIVNENGKLSAFFMSDQILSNVWRPSGKETGYYLGGSFGNDIISNAGEKTGFYIGGHLNKELYGPKKKLPWE